MNYLKSRINSFSYFVSKPTQDLEDFDIELKIRIRFGTANSFKTH